jgi:hypothetical protein
MLKVNGVLLVFLLNAGEIIQSIKDFAFFKRSGDRGSTTPRSPPIESL